jgi:hypothetical protein
MGQLFTSEEDHGEGRKAVMLDHEKIQNSIISTESLCILSSSYLRTPCSALAWSCNLRRSIVDLEVLLPELCCMC